MPFCSNCGQQLGKGINYCSSCGVRQEAIANAVAVAAPQLVPPLTTKRAGYLALAVFGGVIFLSIVIDDALKTQSPVGMSVVCGIGGVIIVLFLRRWKETNHAIRGAWIGWTVSALLLLACLGGLLGSADKSASAGNASDSSLGSTEQTGSSSTPKYTLKQTVHVGYWSYAVWSVKWENSIGSEYMREYPDAKFSVVTMTVQNNDKSASVLPPIKLLDTQGREYEESSKGSLMEGFFGPLKSLNPGVQSSGSVAFDVPPGEYTLEVSGGFTSGENALVKLP